MTDENPKKNGSNTEDGGFKVEIPADLLDEAVEAVDRHVTETKAKVEPEATVLEACEFFIQHRFLALPVVDAGRRMVGVVDVELYTEDDLHSRIVLAQLAFNQREIDFLAERPWWELSLLYMQRYVDKIENEYEPFQPGLKDLDQMSVSDLLKRDGASAAALGFFGGTGSALQTVWSAAIKKLRGTDLVSKKLFRIQGGNQRMTDAFASRLGQRVHLGCPVTGIVTPGKVRPVSLLLL